MVAKSTECSKIIRRTESIFAVWKTNTVNSMGVTSMNEPIILRNLKVEINRENVFRFIDCFPDSPVYQEVEEEYERIIDQMLAFCKPVTILFFDTDKDTVSTSLLAEDAGLCYGIYTIGNEISEYSTRCFQEGEYLAGLLSDAIANEALFQLA